MKYMLVLRIDPENTHLSKHTYSHFFLLSSSIQGSSKPNVLHSLSYGFYLFSKHLSYWAAVALVL